MVDFFVNIRKFPKKFTHVCEIPLDDGFVLLFVVIVC